MIAHGNSGRTAIANAIRLAARGVDHRLVDRLAERLPERERRAESSPDRLNLAKQRVVVRLPRVLSARFCPAPLRTR